MIFKMLKLEFYALEDMDVKEVEERDLTDSLKNVKKFVIDENVEDLKSKILWSLFVNERIKQTKKSKSLYPQCVVFENDKSYPQARFGEGIFLGRVLKGEICLHEKFKIKELRGGIKCLYKIC